MNWAAAAVVLGMTTSAVADEPTVLSDFELDAITAAGVLVDVDSFAAALGTFGDARTDANTFAFDGEDFDVGIGITTGQALACCAEGTDVEVGSTVMGVGDIVHGVTHRVKNDSRGFARGFSRGFVLALSFEEHFAKVRDQHVKVRDEHLVRFEELRTALTAFDIELPDAARSSHLSRYRWSQMAGAQHPW
jgi:hypothetical protein